MKRVIVLAVAIALVGGGPACSKKESTSAYDSAEPTTEATAAAPVPNTGSGVEIKDIAYHPQDLTVKAGTEVTWVSHDGVPHTVTADDGSFDSGNLAQNGTFKHKFTQAGTVAYHCEVHGKAKMSGTVVVQ